MTPAIMQRIALMTTLLEKGKESLLSGIGNRFLLPKFFDYDDDEMNERLGELLEKDEWEVPHLLELTSIFLIMYLKTEFEESNGL